MDKETDGSLMRRAAAGDTEAFGEIVMRYQGPVFRLCLRHLGAADAEDAAQEAFLRGFVHREGFDHERPLLPWLFTIARRTCIDRLRKRREVFGEDLERVRDEGPGPQVVSETRDAMAGVQAALSELPAGQREVLLLYHVEGLAYRQIAEVMEIPIGTVMTWLHRGRTRLRELVGVKASTPERVT